MAYSNNVKQASEQMFCFKIRVTMNNWNLNYMEIVSKISEPYRFLKQQQNPNHTF